MHPMIRRSMDKNKKRGLGPLSGEDSDAKMVPPRFSKLSSSDCTSTDMQEESLPWKSLPSDIQERILALLPLPNIFRLRCVCKRWNALIHCAHFQELSLKRSIPWGPFYLPCIRYKNKLLRVVAWFAYDLAERKRIRAMPRCELPLLNGYSTWSLVTADGGLLCFGSADGQRTLVCNPLTNKWRELPSGSLDSKYTTICCMIVDKERNSYKILFAGNNDHKRIYGTIKLYNSISNTWSIGQDLSIANILIDGAYCNGEYYVLIYHFQTNSYVVVRLDLTTLRWREETIAIPNKCAIHPFIVACLGQLYLVCRRDDSHIYSVESINIFHLDQSNRWTKVSEYPDVCFPREIQGCGSDGLKIYVVKYSWVAIYNCATSCWEKPIHKGNSTHMRAIFKTMFTFQPNLRVAP